jgi:HD-like signal output (HDOD) protein
MVQARRTAWQGQKITPISLNTGPFCVDGYAVSPITLNRVPCRDLALKSLDQLPPFSPVLTHLMASLADDDVSFAKLAAVIERDTVLSGNVLRLVNSALYGRRGTVSSVRAAVSILGLLKLRNFLLGLSVSKLWSRVKTPPTWSMSRFNDHAVSVAVLADLIAQRTSVDYAEGAFVAGLLHDLGRLMIAIALPAEYERIRQASVSSGREMDVCEQELIEVTHAELSLAALTRWNLPAPIQQAVLYHHHPELDPRCEGTSSSPLSRVLSIANCLVNSEGHSIHAEETTRNQMAEEILATIGLSEGAQRIMESFRTELSTMQASL